MKRRTKKAFIGSLLLMLLILQIVVTAGAAITEGVTKVDSLLTLTPDEQASTKTQMVITVNDRSKVQRNLTLHTPSGLTFDQAKTTALNNQETYRLTFEKDQENKITLQQTAKAEAITDTKASTKQYKLVFKIGDVNTLVKQQLVVETTMDGEQYASQPLLFKELIQLDEQPSSSSSVSESSSDSSSLVNSVTSSLKEKLPLVKSQSESVLETPSIDDPGEQDGWVQTDKNIKVPIKVDETANVGHRKYYMYFGGYYTGGRNPNGSSNWGSGQYEVPIGSDNRENVPDAAFFQLLSETESGKIFSAVYNHGTNSDATDRAYGETGLSLLTADTDFSHFKSYNPRRTNERVHALGTDAPKQTFPIYKLMYKKDSAHPGLRAYAMTNGSDGQPEGILRVTMEPINQKGRIRAQIRFISLLKKPKLMAWSYSMHMDLDGLHKSTPTYSLGGTTGLYTYTDRAPSDRVPFKLTYWKDGYPDDPDYELINHEDYNNVEATKSFTNLTLKDGFNRVGDRLQFKLLGRNTEWDTSLTDILITDKVPKQFVVDTATIKLVDSTGKEQTLSPDVYDPVSGDLTVNVPGSMGFNESVYVTFEADIDPSAAGLTITNSMDIYTNKASKHDSSDVQVIVENIAFTMQKRVRNVTNGETDYGVETAAKPGDTVSYQVAIINMSKSREVPSGTVVEDLLDPVLTHTGNVTVQYFNANGQLVMGQTGLFNDQQQITLTSPIPIGGNAKLVFEATVGDTNRKVIDNTATAVNGADKNHSNDAKVTIKKPVKLAIRQAIDANRQADSTQELETGLTNTPPNTYYRLIKITSDANNTDAITHFVINNFKHGYVDNMPGQPPLNFTEASYSLDGGAWVKPASLDTAVRDGILNNRLNIDTTTWGNDQILEPGHTLTIAIGYQLTGTLMANVDFEASLSTPDNQSIIQPEVTTDIDGQTVTAPNFNKVRLKRGQGTITIRYVDLDEDLINPMVPPTLISAPVTYKGTIGEPLSSVTPERVAPKVIKDYTVLLVTEDEELSTANWSDAYKDDPVFAAKDRVITYGYKKKMLSLAAPNYWDFGRYNRTQRDVTYYLDTQKAPQKVTVTDNYGVSDWSLQVQQKRQFTDDRQQELKNAQLRFQHGNVVQEASNTAKGKLDFQPKFVINPGETPKTLMNLTKTGTYQKEKIEDDQSSATNRYDDPGKGIWHYQFGDRQTAGSSIGLFVPATTKRDNTKYTAVLEWSLSVAP
ncbi:Putative CscC cell-surface protein, WxL2 domain [Latilactobacillus curvatus]|uniref:WxL domain-containing protein n=1 Tax=Latilactobacillus curvatus TaxID=28038 RepID=UPI000A1B6DEC|nr:WxL domain-containing protein [Latilactobacillus curvatus]SMH68721.1 Putative CscC cell-surface protein, WxL2 domain [Latilactobacillus curvatus]